MAQPCEAGYSAQLAEDYLRPIGGGTTQSPIGLVCTPADVRIWRQVVWRVRSSIAATHNANPGVTLERSLRARVVAWVAESTKMPEAAWLHLFGTFGECELDVQAMVAFAQDGVNLLAEMHCAVTEADGIVPDAPPKTATTDEGLPGPDALWYLGGGLLALGLILYAVKG